ncbi:CinA family protein [Thiolinea disciformis]|uniref:CinA family protein n=1 Tax=Thiolinea disciformis TaxID=125614 RepID=UPI00037AC823|nr:nicotinamide-nucleotide amidohydrolase family protein [Thiolinea disciformis]
MEHISIQHLTMQLAELLCARQWQLVCAESCTGGGIAKVCTDLAGSSAWFDSGFVVYSNQAKQQVLGVSSDTLQRFGAVSEAVVQEMAQGALQQSSAHVSIAVSGIAGPSGASAEKPVGFICFAWCLPNQAVASSVQYFQGDRVGIRDQAVEFALQELVKRLAAS